MNVVLENDIPIPGKHPEKYPWKTMEIGQSFFKVGNRTLGQALIRAANKRYPDKRFVSRKWQNGFRVWRFK